MGFDEVINLFIRNEFFGLKFFAAGSAITIALGIIFLSQCFRNFFMRLVFFIYFTRIGFISRRQNRFSSFVFLGWNFKAWAVIEALYSIISTSVSAFQIWTKWSTTGNLDPNWVELFFLITGLASAWHTLNFYKTPSNFADARIVKAINHSDPRYIDSSDTFVPQSRVMRIGLAEQKEIIFTDDTFSRYLAENQQEQISYEFNGTLWLERWLPLHKTRHILNRNPNLPFEDALILYRNQCDAAGTSFTNDSKVRLDRLHMVGNRYRAEISKTNYFTSQITNKLFTKALDNLPTRNNFVLDFRQALEDVFRKNEYDEFELKDFDETPSVSNHIGGCVLSVSADGYPLLGIQSSTANENAAQVVASGSGSIDFQDIFRSNPGWGANPDLLSVIRHGMARELLEETGAVLQSSFRPDDRRLIRRYMNNVRVAGYYRSLDWTGLPIFIGMSRHFQTYAAIRENYNRRPCLTQGFELDMWDYKTERFWQGRQPRPITDVKEMVSFLDEALSAGALDNGKTIGMQLHILFELLKSNAPMQQHWNDMLAQDVHV